MCTSLATLVFKFCRRRLQRSRYFSALFFGGGFFRLFGDVLHFEDLLGLFADPSDSVVLRFLVPVGIDEDAVAILASAFVVSDFLPAFWDNDDDDRDV
jgi:hypothetical protein